MKRFLAWLVIGLFVTTILLIPSTSCAGEVFFHTNVKINDVPTNEQTACDICMYTTDIYVVWQDSRDTDKNIYFSRSTSHGANFQTNVRVDDGGAAHSYDPAMAVDSNGKIYVVWSDARTGDIKIYIANSTDKGLSFGSSTRVDDTSGGYNLNYPDIAITTSDKIVVTWSDGRNTTGDNDIYLSNSIDGEDDPGTQQQKNSAIISYLNEIYVVWEDGRNTNDFNVRFRKSTNGGDSFTTSSIDITPGASNADQKAPTITVDNSGNIYVAWADYRTSKYDVNCANSTDGGTSFSLINNVDGGAFTTSQYEPSIYAYSETLLMCVWTDNRGDSSENIYFALSNDKGVTWHNHTQVDDAPPPSSDQNRAVIVSNATGEGQVVWVEPPVNVPPTQTVVNITPTLGSTNTDFLFKLTYYDLDGDMPDTGYPKLYVYSDLAGTVPYKGATYTMDPVNPTDTNVVDGKEYWKTLKYDDEFNFTYKYQVKSDANVELNTSGLLIGPVLDAKDVVFSDNNIDSLIWYTRTDIFCNVTISDINGSGVDGDSLTYRHTKTGIADFTRWYQFKRDDNESISVFKGLVFAEGDQNYIQWNASDIAGNGPTFSDPYQIRIDSTPPEFSDPDPVSGTKVNKTSVDLQVWISDTDGTDIAVSGVNISTLEHRVKLGTADWSEWNGTGITLTDSNATHQRVLVHIKNLSKDGNLIQFRAQDEAGNTIDPLDIPEYNILLQEGLNFAPAPPTWIKPNATADTSPKITWGGAIDPEGDELTYWLQLGTASQKDYLLSWAGVGANTYYDINFELKKDTDYLVQLKCFDGQQYSDVYETTLSITSTGNMPPEAPTNIQPKVTTVYNPTITWDPSVDADSFNIIYYIQISTSEGKGDILPWYQILGTDLKYDVAGSLGLTDGLYYIEIQAYDGFDYSPIGLSTMKVAEFQIGIQDFVTDLTVGEVVTYMINITNLGTAADNIIIYIDGTVFDQAAVYIDDVLFDVLNNSGIAYSLPLDGAWDMKMQFRVKEDAVVGMHSLSFEIFSESGEKTGELIKNNVEIKAKSGPDDDVVDDDDDDDSYGPDKLVKDWWWAILIAVAILLILGVAIGVASSKSKKKKEEEDKKRSSYGDVYERDREEYPPRDRRPPPSHDRPPQRQYPSKASPIVNVSYDEPQQHQEPSQIDDRYVDAMMAEAPAEEPVVEYAEETAYQEEPLEEEMAPIDDELEDDAPKDIYGYDDDEDLDDLDMEPVEEEAMPTETKGRKSPEGDQDDYLSIDDM